MYDNSTIKHVWSEFHKNVVAVHVYLAKFLS